MGRGHVHPARAICILRTLWINPPPGRQCSTPGRMLQLQERVALTLARPDHGWNHRCPHPWTLVHLQGCPFLSGHSFLPRNLGQN
jgi:hypothetical protein